MKALAARIRRAITATIPGTAINLAEKKRRMERDLRAQGLSRSHARALASEKFRTRGDSQ